MTSLEFANQLKARFGDLLSEPGTALGEVSIKLADAERVVEVLGFARKELGFDYLIDVSGLDNYGEDPRWTLVYHLHGLAHGQYLRVKTDVSEEKSELPSVISVWRGADWHE